MTTEDIRQYKLLHIAAAPPETIQGPALSDDIDDGVAPSLARLNFGPNADTDNPLIAALPVMLPLPVGVPFPQEPWSIHEEDTTMTAAYPLAEAWRKGLSYNSKNNRGYAVTARGPLFDRRELEEHMSEFEDVTLVNAGQVPFDMIPPTHALHKAMKDVITEASDMAWFHMGGNLPAEPPAVPPAPPANNNTAGGALNADSLRQLPKRSHTTPVRLRKRSRRHSQQLRRTGSRWPLPGLNQAPTLVRCQLLCQLRCRRGPSKSSRRPSWTLRAGCSENRSIPT